MEPEQESAEEELTPEVRRGLVACVLAAAILRMRPTTSSIRENLSADSNAGLAVVSETLLTVTRGDCSTRDN